MSIPAKPKLTAEERRERWWARNPLPFAVMSASKYDSSVYLIDSRESLYEVALYELKIRADSGYYGSEDDYFSGTYEEYVQKNLGMSVAEADQLLVVQEPKVRELIELKNRYGRMMRAYRDEQVEKETVRNIHRALDTEQSVNPLYVVQLLLDRSHGEYEKFEIRAFNTVPE